MNTTESPKLAEATVQEIQLELIRRRQFNNFDGQRIVHDLFENRNLWEAILLDGQPPLDLVKLRDLSANHWNADTLFILAVDDASAHRLQELGEQWLADSVDVRGEEATGRELGIFPPGSRRIVEMWWD